MRQIGLISQVVASQLTAIYQVDFPEVYSFFDCHQYATHGVGMACDYRPEISIRQQQSGRSCYACQKYERGMENVRKDSQCLSIAVFLAPVEYAGRSFSVTQH